MGSRKNTNFVMRHMTANYLAFFVAGLVLLVSAVVLLLNINEFEVAASQYLSVVVIFMIVFTVLGFVMLMIGVFIAINALSSAKNIEIEEEYITHAPQSSGLRIIRPSSAQQTVDVAPKKEVKVQKTAVVEKAPKKVEIEKEPVKVAKSPAKVEKEIPTDFTYEDGLQSIVDRYNTDKVKKAFKGWYNTMMITFPDISKSALFKIEGDEGLEFSEGVDEEAAVQVKMDSTIFVKMMTKQINPIKAYSSGSLEVKGEMKNMLKLRKLMF